MDQNVAEARRVASHGSQTAPGRSKTNQGTKQSGGKLWWHIKPTGPGSWYLRPSPEPPSACTGAPAEARIRVPVCASGKNTNNAPPSDSRRNTTTAHHFRHLLTPCNEG